MQTANRDRRDHRVLPVPLAFKGRPAHKESKVNKARSGLRAVWGQPEHPVLPGFKDLLALPARLVMWVLLELLVLLAVLGLRVHLALWELRERKALRGRKVSLGQRALLAHKDRKASKD